MRESSFRELSLALSAITALTVLTAGCVAQDRPHVEAFFVVADAGENDVVAQGDTAHLSWPENRTLEAEEGAPPHEEVEYHWQTSSGLTGSETEFNVTPAAPGLTLVELNVTAKAHTASDISGLLTVPSGSAGSGRLYLASLGGLALSPEGSGPPPALGHVAVGGHEGEFFDLALPGGGGSMRFSVALPSGLSVEEVPAGAFLIAVKEASGAVHEHATPPLEFDPGLQYTLVVDTSPGGAHRLEARGEGGAIVENVTLSDFETAHGAEHEAKVLVPAPAQTLPGFEGAAAAAAFAGASALAAVASRRRP